MERMERTAQAGGAAGAAARVTTMRPRQEPAIPDVPAWDVVDIPVAAIEALRDEVSALRARLSDAAPRRAVVEMDRAITLLNRRVEDIREAGTAGAQGREEALAHELAELKAAVGTLLRNDRLKAVDAGLEALSRKIDLMGAKAVDPVEIARLHTQLAELTDLVARAVTGPGGTRALHLLSERLAACAEDIARASEAAARRMADAAGTFERNAAALLDRVEHLEARARAGDSAAAEDLQHSLLLALEQVHRRLDSVSSEVGRQVAALSPAIAAELTGRLDALLARITAAEAAGKAAVAPLADVVERHLLALTEQFRDTHARLGRLDTIETSLQRMVEEMRQVRETTHSAATEAVRAVTAKVSEDSAGPAVVGLKRGLAALEARQDEIERRAGEFLAGELELELQDVAVSLGRDGDGSFAPRTASHAPRSTPQPEAREDPALWAEAIRPAEQKAAPAFEAGELRAAQAAPSGPGDVPWPRARRAPAEGPGGADPRPRVNERKGAKPRRERRAQKGGFLSGRLASKRQVAMVALIAGATTVFAGTAVGLAWRNGPDLVASMNSAVRRLAAPAVAGVSSTELPAATGSAALQSAARAGDPAAAFAVANRFADAGDLDAAVKWLAQAMAQGSAPAAYRLGALYEAAGRDLGEARRFYEWAATQGNVRAMHALAMLLSEGRGSLAPGKPDWDGAVRWFRIAAELGHRDSQYNLGVVYARGLGVAADLGEAWKWLCLAANQGDDDSASKRDIIARDADPETLARAQKAVAAFVPGKPSPAANQVELRPEWTDVAPAPGVASSSAAPSKPLRVASRTTPAANEAPAK
ncbi:hypothetical protein V5F59_23850 [Xanthobacter autotrophicus DSM 431]|uniref:hypothetical protein n=1 Tax=Xanthobacter nonsaccharivorans TaxID=3119912 RepID=UPI00372A9D82